MPQYEVTFTAPAEVRVTITAENESSAAELAWQQAEDYAQTVYGDAITVQASLSFDGVGADSVRQVGS